MKTIVARVDFIFQVADDVQITDRTFVRFSHTDSGKLELVRPLLDKNNGYEILGKSSESRCDTIEELDFGR